MNEIVVKSLEDFVDIAKDVDIVYVKYSEFRKAPNIRIEFIVPKDGVLIKYVYKDIFNKCVECADTIWGEVCIPDWFCVARHRDEYEEYVKGKVDEIKSKIGEKRFVEVSEDEWRVE